MGNLQQGLHWGGFSVFHKKTHRQHCHDHRMLNLPSRGMSPPAAVAVGHTTFLQWHEVIFKSEHNIYNYMLIDVAITWQSVWQHSKAS